MRRKAADRAERVRKEGHDIAFCSTLRSNNGAFDEIDVSAFVFI